MAFYTLKDQRTRSNLKTIIQMAAIPLHSQPSVVKISPVLRLQDV